MFDPAGGAKAARADFEFFTEAGQLQGPASELKVEDYWDLGPLTRAAAKLGG
jgi:NitT/TauT family transport system substrate-binding protein